MCRECGRDPALVAACLGQRSEALRRAYLFEDLGAPELEEVVVRSREVELGADDWVCLLGEPAAAFYLVLAGEVALLRHSEQGEEVIVAIVGPGELFGEDLAFLADATHPLSARPLGPTRVVAVDRRHFRSLLERRPELATKLLHTLHRRNTILLEEIERRTVQSATERLLAFLDRQAASGSPLRLTKRVLAARLSIRPETLSRILAQLKACHRVREEDGCLVPLPCDGDEEACEVCPARTWGCPGPDAEAADLRPAPGYRAVSTVLT